MIWWKQRSDSGYNSVAYNQVKTALSESEAVQAKELNQLQSGKRALYWFILLLLLPIPTIYFLLDCKRQNHKQSQKKMEMFWFFWIPFHCAHGCAYNSNFLFSQGHKSSYDSTSLALPTLTPSLLKSSLKALGFYNFCYRTALLNTIIKKNIFSSKSLSCCLKGHQIFFIKFNAVITVNT